MGFKLKLKMLNEQNFMQGIERLATFELAPKAAYNIGKILDKIRQEHKTAGDGFKKIVGKYCEKDDKGEWKPEVQKMPGPDGKEGEVAIPGSYIIPKDKNDVFKKEVDEFLDIDFEINRFKVKLSDLGETKMQPNLLAALEPMLDEEAHLQTVQ